MVDDIPAAIGHSDATEAKKGPPLKSTPGEQSRQASYLLSGARDRPFLLCLSIFFGIQNFKRTEIPSGAIFKGRKSVSDGRNWHPCVTHTKKAFF